jgi:hypothetical protein
MLTLALALPPPQPPLFAARAPRARSGDHDAPKVVSLDPENLAVDIDGKKTTKLVVIFDRPMSDTGWSFCGGGPTFPAFKGKPHWDTPKKIVVDVELQPDHEYQLGLNCPSATNFRSTQGVPLVPVVWSFATGPDKMPDPVKQRAENRQAFEALKDVLAESYSYYDLRVRSWDKLYREHEAAILGAKTTRAWAGAVAKMLAATEDLHLYLRCAERVLPTGTRAVDPVFRSLVVAHYVPVKTAGARGLQGRTEDGIGYLMIGAWENPRDADAIEEALGALRNCKALIVDVRPNSGGDELLARRIAAWFVEGTQVYGKDRFRVKAGKDGFGPIQERTITGNTDAGKRIDVPIAVLTSRYVMSSNESFVLMMRQAQDCTVVGQKTQGSSGNPQPHALPNDVTIMIPSWQDLRPDGTCFEGEGLAPDIEVAVDAKSVDTQDPVLEKALALVRGKIK